MSFVQKAIEKIQAQARQTVAPSAQAPDSADLPPLAAAPDPAPEPAPFRARQTLAVDRAALSRAGLLPNESDARRVAEQFRRIKRPLMRSLANRTGDELDRAHLVLVASALPGEGKTFTATNLAFNLALERDIGVLLIDADVAKPHLSRELGLANVPGLLDALEDSTVDVEGLIYGTDNPSLLFLPAGRPSDLANELLESDRMLEICAQLTRRLPNHVLLFDSAPLLLTNEGVAVSHIVGQVVLVVRAGGTPRSAVQEAIASIGDGPKVGVVLNQASPALGQQGYYTYGTYGYPAPDGRSGA